MSFLRKWVEWCWNNDFQLEDLVQRFKDLTLYAFASPSWACLLMRLAAKWPPTMVWTRASQAAHPHAAAAGTRVCRGRLVFLDAVLDAEQPDRATTVGGHGTRAPIRRGAASQGLTSRRRA